MQLRNSHMVKSYTTVGGLSQAKAPFLRFSSPLSNVKVCRGRNVITELRKAASLQPSLKKSVRQFDKAASLEKKHNKLLWTVLNERVLEASKIYILGLKVFITRKI